MKMENLFLILRIDLLLQYRVTHLDPDHKIEYTPDQLESILRKHNFSISDSWGLLPMPMTFQLKKFSPQEVYDHALLSEDLKVCYLFAFSCTRN